MLTSHLKSNDVAEYFINRAKKENSALTPKKLQKMLYYAQAWFLVFEDKKLFNEKIEAWLHGPAILSIYQKYKIFGFSPIIKEVNQDILNKIPSSIEKFLSDIWKVYGKFDADYLEILSHNEDPWRKARINVGEFSASKNEITDIAMKTFYKQLLNQNTK